PAPAELQAQATADAIESTSSIPSRERVDAKDEIPAAAIWIEGRVVFPPGAPAEDRVEVLSSASRREKSRHFPVAPDGTVRAAVSKDTEKGTLDIGAPFLHLRSPAEVALAGRALDAPRVVLAPKVGGCVRGRIVLPPNALERRDKGVAAHSSP